MSCQVTLSELGWLGVLLVLSLNYGRQLVKSSLPASHLTCPAELLVLPFHQCFLSSLSADLLQALPQLLLNKGRARVCVLDVHQLQHAGFETQLGRDELTHAISESTIIPTVFFDVRTYSDTLHHYFYISLQGTVDVQLL